MSLLALSDSLCMHGSRLSCTRVAVEKIALLRKPGKLWRRKCPSGRRKLLVGHPGAISFLRISQMEFFDTHRDCHSSSLGRVSSGGPILKRRIDPSLCRCWRGASLIIISNRLYFYFVGAAVLAEHGFYRVRVFAKVLSQLFREDVQGFRRYALKQSEAPWKVRLNRNA